MESRAEYLRARNDDTVAIMRATFPWWLYALYVVVCIGGEVLAASKPIAAGLASVLLFVMLVARSIGVVRAHSAIARLFAPATEIVGEGSEVNALPTYMRDPKDIESAAALDQLLVLKSRGKDPFSRLFVRVMIAQVLLLGAASLTLFFYLNVPHGAEFGPGAYPVFWVLVTATYVEQFAFLWVSAARLRRLFSLAYAETDRLGATDPGFSGKVLRYHADRYVLTTPWTYRGNSYFIYLAICLAIMLGISIFWVVWSFS